MIWHLDADAVAEECLRRVRDEKLPLEMKVAAAHILAGEWEEGLTLQKLWAREGKLSAAVWRKSDALCDRVADRTLPMKVRQALLEALPWAEPAESRKRLEDLAREILAHPEDPLREAVARSLLAPHDRNFRAILLDALAADDRLPIPLLEYGPLPRSEDFAPLLLKRLESGETRVSEAARVALRHNGPYGTEALLGGFLGSESPSLRYTAALFIRNSPRAGYLGALREAMREETEESTLAECIEAVRLLGDRVGLKTVLARELSPGSPAAQARIRAVASLGTREEILALERRLADPTVWTPTEIIPAIARADAEAGRRVVAKVMVHPLSWYRAVAAEAIGEGRLSEFLPALRAMSLTESPDVRQSALRALGSFDRSVWLPAYRTALRRSPDAYGDFLWRMVVGKAETELAGDVWTILRQSDYEFKSARWAQALDACVNGEHFRQWSRLEIGVPLRTPAALWERLGGQGLKVEISEGAKALLHRPLRSEIFRPTSFADFTASLLVEGEAAQGSPIYLTHISNRGGVLLVTLDEAMAYWSRIFPR